MSQTLIDVTVFAWIGWAATTAALLGAWWVSALLGVAAFKRITRVYHISVLGYWLNRIERHGVREFRKAEQYDIEEQHKRANKAWEYQA